jgi:hypothetical protein
MARAEGELQRLAQARGESVRRELAEAGKIDATRVNVAAAVKKDDGGKLVPGKMSLGAGRWAAAQPPAGEAPAVPPRQRPDGRGRGIGAWAAAQAACHPADNGQGAHARMP